YPGAARLGQLDGNGKALALRPHRSADDVIDIENPAGFFGSDAPLVQCEHRPLRDDEEAPQLGEAGDHVVGERVCRPAPDRGRWGTTDERPDGNRAAARYRCGGFAAAFDRDYRRCPGRVPGVADRGAIEAIGFEQPGGRRNMLLGLANPAAPREGGEEDLVGM